MSTLSYIATLRALQTPNVLSTLSGDSCGDQIAALTGGIASFIWNTANVPLYVPFQLRASVTIKQLWYYNGATASGNVNMGIFDSAGTLKVQGPSQAQGATSSVVSLNIADTALVAGSYYWAIVLDNIVGTIMMAATGGSAFCRLCGVLGSAANFALASTTYITAPASSRVPIVGMSLLATF